MATGQGGQVGLVRGGGGGAGDSKRERVREGWGGGRRNIVLAQEWPQPQCVLVTVDAPTVTPTSRDPPERKIYRFWVTGCVIDGHTNQGIDRVYGSPVQDLLMPLARTVMSDHMRL